MDKKQWANVALCLVLFGVFCYGVHRAAGAADVVDLFDPAVAESSLVHELKGDVVLEDVRFDINQVNKAVRAEFRVANHARFPVSDIVVSCDYRDREGELRGRGRWLVYETAAPGKTGSFVCEERTYISHLVVPETIRCRIVDLKARGFSVASHQGH